MNIPGKMNNSQQWTNEVNVNFHFIFLRIVHFSRNIHSFHFVLVNLFIFSIFPENSEFSLLSDSVFQDSEKFHENSERKGKIICVMESESGMCVIEEKIKEQYKSFPSIAVQLSHLCNSVLLLPIWPWYQPIIERWKLFVHSGYKETQ